MADGGVEVLTANGYADYPPATNPVDQMRVDWLRQVLRLLDGLWETDLRTYMSAHVEASRLKSWGPPSMALNLAKSLIKQINCLYDDEVSVRNADFDDESEGLMSRLLTWPRWQRHARDVIGLRESAIRIEHAADAPDGIHLRLVPATEIEVEGSPSVPTVPRLVRWARRRKIGFETHWCWDTWDIREPDAPTFRIVRNEGMVDVTVDVLGAEEAGRPYRWVDPDGRPYLPWVLYHAADTGQMWDSGEWHELVQGTYAIAMLWTFWIHALKEASWEQKVAIDLVLQGTRTAGSGADTRSRIAVDPASILMFKSTDGRGTVTSIGASIDPLAMAQAIVAYQQIVATHLGVSPADVQVTSGSGQSGVAISLTRAGIRTMQRRYQPQFRAGDEELLQKVAWTHNIFGDPSYPKLPASGYRVTYAGVPLTAEEIRTALERNAALIAQGLRSEVDVIMEMEPGMDRAEAMERLRQIAREQAEIARLRAGGAPDVEPPPERQTASTLAA